MPSRRQLKHPDNFHDTGSVQGLASGPCSELGGSQPSKTYTPNVTCLPAKLSAVV